MKTVSKLLAASICFGMSASSVYAQPAATQPAKPVAPMADAAKVKGVQHKLAAPAETAPASAKKSVEHREHSAKTVPPTAAAIKSDKIETSHANLEKTDAAAKVHHEIKPSAKAAKPAVKVDPSVEAPKALK